MAEDPPVVCLRRFFMKKIRLLFLITLLYSSFCGAEAQSTIYEKYAQEAGDALMIYRGRKAMHYSFQFNGTFYWERSEFMKGDVVYNGKKYKDLLLNIDANLQLLMVKHPANALTVVLNPTCLTSFNIGEKQFINRDEGIFEVIRDGKVALLRQITRKFSQNIHLKNGEEIGYYDPDFKENVFHYFKYESTLYCLKDDVLTPIKSGRDILNYFPYHKRQLRVLIRRANISPKRNLEEYCLRVIGYVESTLE